MGERFRELMARESISASRLAQILGIQPAAISHIINGRNKPGYDLICKIVDCFPQINIYWLLGKSSQMYKDDTVNVRQQTINLTQSIEENTIHPDENILNGSITSTVKNDVNSSESFSTGNVDNVETIVFIYPDKTFKIFKQNSL